MRTLRLALILGACAAAAGAHASDQKSDPGYLGAHVESNANVLDPDNAYSGVTVTDVVENSPAELAGLEPGDVIVRMNDREISSSEQLDAAVGALGPGEGLSLEVDREGRLLTLKTTTVARLGPGANPEPDSNERWIERRGLGFEFSSVSDEQRAAAGLEAGLGVAITRLAERSPLMKAELGSGALITRLDGNPIFAPANVIEYLGSRGEQKHVRLRVVSAEGEARRIKIPLFKPDRKVTRLSLFPLIRYENDEEKTLFSFLLALVRAEWRENASRYRLFWIFRFETGAWDELIEIE